MFPRSKKKKIEEKNEARRVCKTHFRYASTPNRLIGDDRGAEGGREGRTSGPKDKNGGRNEGEEGKGREGKGKGGKGGAKGEKGDGRGGGRAVS